MLLSHPCAGVGAVTSLAGARAEPPTAGRLSPRASPGRRATAAFSIIEVLVAAVIVGIVFFALYSGVSSGFTVVELARENLRATQVVTDKMETIRLYNWSQINSNGFIPSTFVAPFYATNSSTNTGLLYYGTITITNAPVTEAYADALRLVTVQVSWTSLGQERQRTMSTLVSQYGMQNYIYYK